MNDPLTSSLTRTIVFAKEGKARRVFSIHSKMPRVKGTVTQLIKNLDALEKYLTGMELLTSRLDNNEIETVFRELMQNSLPQAKSRASDAAMFMRRNTPKEQLDELSQEGEQIRCLADIKFLILENVKGGVNQILDWDRASLTWTKETLDELRVRIDRCCGALRFFPPLAIVEELKYSESFTETEVRLKVRRRDAWLRSIPNIWDIDTDPPDSDLGAPSTADWNPLGIYPPPDDFLSGDVGLLSEFKSAFLVELENRLKELQEHEVKDTQTETSRLTVTRLKVSLTGPSVL